MYCVMSALRHVLGMGRTMFLNMSSVVAWLACSSAALCISCTVRSCMLCTSAAVKHILLTFRMSGGSFMCKM